MAKPKVTDEQIIEAYKTHEGNKHAMSRELGVERSSIRDRLKRLGEKGLLGYKPVIEGFRVSQVTTVQDADGNVQREFIQQKPERGDRFEIPEGQKLKGVSALVDPDGQEIIKWIKTTAESVDNRTLLDSIKEQLQAASSFTPLPPAPIHTTERLLTLYPIADVHLGAFAWGRENGGDDYDLDISERILKGSTGELISRSAAAKVGLVLDVGDFFHADNNKAETAKSHNKLDVDSRHPKVVKTGFMAVVWIIEQALQKHERVIYRKLPGNHDEETSSTFALGIWAWFRDNPRVEVDISPARTFMYQHGTTMIVATHGDMLKATGLAGWAAAEHPVEWGATTFRYGWTGHIHHKSAITSPGMVVESLTSPAAKDAWHAASGFCSPRNMISITYDMWRGERDRLTVAIGG